METLFLDLQGTKTESDFVKLFKKELEEEKWWEKTKSKFGDTILNLFDSIKEFEVSGIKGEIKIENWRNDTYEKIRQLIENIGEILIVIDELIIYLNHLLGKEKDKDKVEFFLEWMRNFRQTTKGRWILCSSVGIENFISQHQLNKHLNDLQIFHIGAFLEEEAKEFISLLDVDEKVQFTEDNIQHILKKLGGWPLPYFIHLLVERINHLICLEGKRLSEETIDEAYNRLLIENNFAFNAWDERLSEYGELENDLRKILKLCAVPDGRSRDNLLTTLYAAKGITEETEVNLSRLLTILNNDGYIIEHNGKYVFHSPLLRDFWYVRFVK